MIGNSVKGIIRFDTFHRNLIDFILDRETPNFQVLFISVSSFWGYFLKHFTLLLIVFIIILLMIFIVFLFLFLFFWLVFSLTFRNKFLEFFLGQTSCRQRGSCLWTGVRRSLSKIYVLWMPFLWLFGVKIFDIFVHFRFNWRCLFLCFV